MAIRRFGGECVHGVWYDETPPGWRSIVVPGYGKVMVHPDHHPQVALPGGGVEKLKLVDPTNEEVPR